MSYTKAFEQLHQLSFEIDLNVTIQYKRVAIYLGRVMMADTARPSIFQQVDLDNPIRTDMEWVEQLAGHKEMMLDLVVALDQKEWDLVQRIMVDYAKETKGSDVWLRKRMGMIHQLDTLRAFNS